MTSFSPLSLSYPDSAKTMVISSTQLSPDQGGTKVAIFRDLTEKWNGIFNTFRDNIVVQQFFSGKLHLYSFLKIF